MKILTALFLLFNLSLAAFSQTISNNFVLKGKFDFDNPSERVLFYKLLDGGRKIQLVGSNTVQLWDVAEKKVLDSRKHKIENLNSETLGAFSPDKTKIVVLGARREDNTYSHAAVYEVETGRQIAVLDKSSNPVRAAFWSKNGATLVTSDDENFARDSGYRYALEGGELVANKLGEIEVSFYDGASIEHRATVSVSNLTWRHLTDDGERLLTTSGPKKDLLGIDYASQKAEEIAVWNTRSGKLDTSLTIGDEIFFTRTRKLTVSPGGQFLAFVQKSRKDDAGDKMLVWQIGGGAPKYAVQANPKIGDSEVGYSPDNKFVALDAGKNTQIYELETGQKKFEISNLDVPDLWFGDNRVAFYHKGDKIRAFEIPGGKQIFEEKVAYETIEVGTGSYTTDSNGNYKEDTETKVVDYTRIIPSPNGRFFIAYSNYSVKIYNALTGENLRTLVTTPLEFKKKKKKILGIPLPDIFDRRKKLVEKAEWSADGKLILIFDADKTAVSIWEFSPQ